MNVLIVDDEIDTLNEISFYVREYESISSVTICTNPLQALKEIGVNHFDIALLDIEMPSMNGFELAEQLINYLPNIKVAFITAYNTYATEAFDVNAIDYVLKPIRKERLFKALDRLTSIQNETFHTNDNKPKLVVQTFGKFIIKIGNDIVRWNRKKSSELFAYLLENIGVPVHKEKLCDLLWPDLEPKKALVNLQTTVYSIRKTLGKYDNYEISIYYAEHSYTLSIEDVFIDVIEFEENLERALDLQDTMLLRTVLRMYRGNYLEEDGWIWAEPKKEMLRKKHIFAVKVLKKIIHDMKD